TFDSSTPVAVIALLGFVNERSEFLTTTLPVIDLSSVSRDPVIVPQLAAGGGWKTDIILLNPTDEVVSGKVRLLSPSGQDETVMIDGMNVSSVAYTIPARSSRKLGATGGISTRTGSFGVTPDQNQFAPAVATVYTYAADGVTTSATGLVANPTAQEFDIYTEVEGATGTIGSVQTGVAIANPANEPVEVDYEL